MSGLFSPFSIKHVFVFDDLIVIIGWQFKILQVTSNGFVELMRIVLPCPPDRAFCYSGLFILNCSSTGIIALDFRDQGKGSHDKETKKWTFEPLQTTKMS